MRKVFLAILLMLIGSCGDDQRTLRVRGRLTGHGDTALAGAYVSLIGQGDRFRHTTDTDGNFVFDVAKPGGYWLWLTGPHHQSLLMPLYIDETLAFDVRLATAICLDKIDDVRVIGNFNEFSRDEGVVQLTRQDDGTFAGDVTTDLDTLRYQLLGVQIDDLPLAGIPANRYEFDAPRPLLANRAGKYLSVAGVTDGRVRVEFDPAALPASDAPPRVTFTDSTLTSAALVETDRWLQQRLQKLADTYKAYGEAGKDPADFESERKANRVAIAQRFGETENDLVRGYLLLSFFRFGHSPADSTLAQSVFADLPPTSDAWSLQWGGPYPVFATVAEISQSPQDALNYANRVIEEHGDPSVRPSFLFFALEHTRQSGQIELANAYYTRLRDDYPDGDYSMLAKQLYAPNRNTAPGEPVPDFTFTAMDDPSVIYTPHMFRGRILLLDFWATWCDPCIGEMAYLHAAYEKYHRRGLEILSVSFDRSRDTVHRFRFSGEWEMPWHHVRSGSSGWYELTTRFEIGAIPEPILVDANGIIIEKGMNLRMNNLDEALSRVFGADE